ncbi:hypothetical protein [Endozoicomonas sp. SCSIO W0465]|uniref:hypothetical protein n=1 Tax=Endozoicomonas sp. SCSIO W0465 TaxID=2918516 RepID=UPI002075BA53|nr:hypothetical protein [Endozoicomonas sp. SCSIO W0465]USE34820.1 hypothetical protein MJO57_22215 [Endozoicomonas sp. SCSIO W0465]
MSTPASNHSVATTSTATVAATEPLPGGNNRKRYFSGHRVQPVDRENRRTQEVFRPRLCETKQPAKKRRCGQRVDTGQNGTSASTGRDSTFPMMGHEVSASRPVVIVHPQPMDIDPDYSEIIAKFSVTHQHQIMPSLSHPGVKTVLSNVSTLLKTLEQRGIQLSMNRGNPPLPTLFAKLKPFNMVTEHQTCSGYFQKANVFFSAVGKTVNNTGSLTSTLHSKNSVTLLTNMDDGDVAAIAASPFLKQISSMCHCKGLPEKSKIEAFLEMGCLKVGWQGIDGAVKDQPLDRSLVANISSMCHGKGLPEKAKVEAFLKLGCLKEGWQGIDEAVKDQPIDRALVSHISSMFFGKGLPEKAKMEAS